MQEGFNPRSGRERTAFEELVASIREDGVLQPVLVGTAGYRLVAGEGRYLAAAEAVCTEIPALVRGTGGRELALAENLAREDLDPVEQARGFQRLKGAGRAGAIERAGGFGR